MSELKVFVSWSRSASRKAAEALKEWLPKVLPGADPWMSKIDITKGKPWFASISAQLAQSRVSIICVTNENVGSPWLYFEAGAIAHRHEDALICAFLIGVEPSKLSGTPLGQYQCTVFEKEDMWRLIKDINGILETPNSNELLRGNFDSKWPVLQKKLARIMDDLEQQEPVAPKDADGKTAAVLSPEGNVKHADATNIVAPAGPAYDDNDMIALLQRWMKNRSHSDNLKAIVFADVDREVGLPGGAAKRLLVTAAAKSEYVPDITGENVITFKGGPQPIGHGRMGGGRPNVRWLGTR